MTLQPGSADAQTQRIPARNSEPPQDGKRPSWPLAPTTLRPAFRQVALAYLNYVGGLSGEHQRVITLLAGPILTRSLTLAELALVAQCDPAWGQEIPGVDYVAGRGPLASTTATEPADGFQRLSFLWLRRARCVARWTPWWRMPTTMAFPDVTAINRNELLEGEIEHRSSAVSFHHADQILVAARSRGQRSDGDWSGLAAQAFAAVLAPVEMPPDVLARCVSLGVTSLRGAFQLAANDLACLSEHELPGSVLSGSGGQYAARAVGQEVLRRGGAVERFEHGGPYGIVDLDTDVAISDVSVSSRYTCFTPAKAELIKSRPVITAAAPTVEIAGGHGSPEFRSIPRKTPASARQKPRVVYATTVLWGSRRQHPAPLLTDAVYIDWQFQLAAMISKLPVDLVVKPHPQALRARSPYPLADRATISTRPLEDLIPEADVFVFDYIQSTALWSVLCSDRRAVFIDLGISALLPSIMRPFRERCSVVQARYDDANRPLVDPNELSDAILAQRPVDPGFFRSLLAGD